MTRESEKLHIIYTPFVWVERCHHFMHRIFGDSWYDQVVWDLSCGDRAMTKDHSFSKLLSSDIRPEVNPDFVYDATKIDEQKMPETLVRALKNRYPIIIFTNTPFGVVGKRVRKMIVDLKNKYNARIIFACITNLFVTNRSKIEDEWVDNFHFLSGFMFQSTEFPELKSSWPVIFSVWIGREREWNKVNKDDGEE